MSVHQSLPVLSFTISDANNAFLEVIKRRDPNADSWSKRELMLVASFVGAILFLYPVIWYALAASIPSQISG